MFCYVWEYLVQPENVSAFQLEYGPDGQWVRLFQRDPAYVRTELLRDHDNATRFITIDYWSSRDACRAFRQRFDAEFQEIDTRCAIYTIRETHLGDFTC